jgi:hypothetical protein
MCTAEEKFSTPLKATEYRLLDILCHLSDNGVVDATLEELATYAQCSDDSVSRALRGLEAASLIETTRTKRNLGKFHTNKYKLLVPSHQSAIPQNHQTADLPHRKNAVSTADSNNSNNLLANKTTSYLVAPATKGRKPFILVNRWMDEDENIKGFGLFDDDVTPESKPVSKRDPKTRHQRPQDEWTAGDVASEFASRLYKAIPGVPNLVNTQNLRGALSKMRKQYNINATIELEIMEMFFQDPWIKTQGRERPQYLMGRFLKMFSTHFTKAMDNLGITEEFETPEETREEMLYASDGRQFDNSVFGRASLAEYEEKLRRKNVV